MTYLIINVSWGPLMPSVPESNRIQCFSPELMLWAFIRRLCVLRFVCFGSPETCSDISRRQGPRLGHHDTKLTGRDALSELKLFFFFHKKDVLPFFRYNLIHVELMIGFRSIQFLPGVFWSTAVYAPWMN